ncbi:unnamed protein product [Meloidogyne enterolobii]|uniref:Uncharacterized protein n=1 Tax=Meloidogyne enterolobii TaxID=390850 RepID=A0ACB0XVM0_MELEN
MFLLLNAFVLMRPIVLSFCLLLRCFIDLSPFIQFFSRISLHNRFCIYLFSPTIQIFLFFSFQFCLIPRLLKHF